MLQIRSILLLAFCQYQHMQATRFFQSREIFWKWYQHSFALYIFTFRVYRISCHHRKCKKMIILQNEPPLRPWMNGDSMTADGVFQQSCYWQGERWGISCNRSTIKIITIIIHDNSVRVIASDCFCKSVQTTLPTTSHQGFSPIF